MPKPFVYAEGEDLRILVKVVGAADPGNPAISIGGHVVVVPQVALDKADLRATSLRPLTPEEEDLARLTRERDEAELAAREAEHEREEKDEKAEGKAARSKGR